MQKNLCMIGTQFIGVPADTGGAIEYLSFKLAQGLKKDFNITYFSVNPKIKFNSEKNLVIERFPAKKTNGFFFSLFILRKALFRKFDGVYVSGCSMIFIGLLISKIKGIPLIYHEFNHNPWLKPNNKLYDFLAKFSVIQSDYVLIASDLIKQKVIEITEVNSKKIIKKTNFISLNEFPVKPEKKENKILFVGRAVKHKGIDFLIKLAEKDFIGWNFEFIFPKTFSEEEKNYSDKIQKLVKSSKRKITLKQNLSRKDLIKEFSSASILILPSSMESFGLVLIEAMACFTPCIAFSVGGTKEIIKDNQNGFLVELNNQRLFEERLTELIKNEKKRISFGLNARKTIEEKFSFNAVIKEYTAFFNKVIK